MHFLLRSFLARTRRSHSKARNRAQYSCKLRAQVREESLDKIDKFEITGAKLLAASAAEIIIVFGPECGARIVVELARIVQGVCVYVCMRACTRARVSLYLCVVVARGFCDACSVGLPAVRVHGGGRVWARGWGANNRRAGGVRPQRTYRYLHRSTAVWHGLTSPLLSQQERPLARVFSVVTVVFPL